MRTGALASAVVSILFAALAFLLFPRGAERRAAGGRSFVTVAFDEGVDGAAVLDAFARHGIRGALGEANQVVFINDFSSLTPVRPSVFASRVLEFDPRDDGFARRMLRFFVSDGESRFYIPLSFDAAGLERRLRLAAADFGGYSVHFPEAAAASGRAPVSAVPFWAAWLITVCFSILYMLRNRLDDRKAPASARTLPRVFPLLVLVPLYRAGWAGALLTASLLSLRVFTAFFTSNLIIRLYHRRRAHTERAALVLGGAHLLAFIILCAGTVGLRFAAPVLVLFFGADTAAVVCTMLVLSNKPRLRFQPVSLRLCDDPKYRVPPSALIFLAFALLGFCLSRTALPAGGLRAASILPRTAAHSLDGLDEAAYREHYRFQHTFAFRRLGADGGAESGGEYLHYTLGGDGFIAGSESLPAVTDAGAPPPYSLSPLLGWLDGRALSPISPALAPRGGGVFALLLPLPFAVFYLRMRRRRKKGF
ncbi:MAG: hypothetical protein LBC72_02375, partial [Spirochaetaceae bacterium]|nr:hypothetical protein [Spirochaetaceae bacterium]